MSLAPENFRVIADRIEQLMNEAEKIDGEPSADDNNRKSLDDLLSSPAGAKKLADQIDKNKLVNILKLDTADGDDLWMSIQNLSKDSPTISKENSLAILKAFQKLAPKSGSEDALSINEAFLIEKYNKNFDDPVGWSIVEKTIKKASEISPLAKDYALHLANTLTKGSKNRNLDEGLEGVFNAVIYAVSIAETGDRSALLHMIDDFETKYEGDTYAFDQNLWNDLMKNLKGSAKEVLVRAK
jgi:hypothetical protein